VEADERGTGGDFGDDVGDALPGGGFLLGEFVDVPRSRVAKEFVRAGESAADDGEDVERGVRLARESND